ncbi:MAG: hypothetical protein U0794_13025 [Isosphaeraceae bacterium]
METLWATRRVGELIDEIDLKGRNKELIDELVALSTKYGLLTPYTSFLADDRVPLHAYRENFGRAQTNLHLLEDVSGRRGVVQRDLKRQYKAAERPALGESETQVAKSDRFDALSAGAYGGGLGTTPRYNATTQPMPGMAGAGAPIAAGGMAGKVVVQQEAREAGAALAANVRQIGAKTFFRKGNRWVDSSVKPEEDAKAVVIVQFSDAYFALAREQSAELNRYLAFTEPVTVRLGNQIIRIEQASR